MMLFSSQNRVANKGDKSGGWGGGVLIFWLTVSNIFDWPTGKLLRGEAQPKETV
jgi:hypothetical protein